MTSAATGASRAAGTLPATPSDDFPQGIRGRALAAPAVRCELMRAAKILRLAFEQPELGQLEHRLPCEDRLLSERVSGKVVRKMAATIFVEAQNRSVAAGRGRADQALRSDSEQPV